METRQVKRIAALPALLVCTSCGLLGRGDDPLPTLDGPEHAELLERVGGWLIATTHERRIEVIDLPTLARHEIATRDRVWFIAGPDRRGRIAYVSDGSSRHQLRITNVDGSHDELIFDRPGDALWDGAIGGLTLSSEGVLAFWSHADEQTHGELFDLDSGALRTFAHPIEPRDLAWMPDGKQLLVGGGYLLNVASDAASAPIADEWSGIAEPDGAHAWVGALTNPKWSRVELATGVVERVEVPWMWPVAAAGPDLVLACACPTSGVEPHVLRTLQKPPQAMWTLKLFDVTSREFVTVYDEVARFHEFSWGAR